MGVVVTSSILKYSIKSAIIIVQTYFDTKNIPVLNINVMDYQKKKKKFEKWYLHALFHTILLCIYM